MDGVACPHPTPHAITFTNTPTPTLTPMPSSGCSAVRLAHLLWEQGVAGSNPATPTTECSFTVYYKFLNPVLNRKVRTLSEMAGFFVLVQQKVSKIEKDVIIDNVFLSHVSLLHQTVTEDWRMVNTNLYLLIVISNPQ